MTTDEIQLALDELEAPGLTCGGSFSLGEGAPISPASCFCV
jgi:hypothetical protein